MKYRDCDKEVKYISQLDTEDMQGKRNAAEMSMQLIGDGG